MNRFSRYPSLRVLLVSVFVAVVVGLVGCDSGGAGSDAPSDRSPDDNSPTETISDEDLDKIDDTVVVRVGDESKSSAKAPRTKAGGGVLTVTFFYASNANASCTATARATVAPPSETTLRPAVPSCKDGSRQGLSVSFTPIEDSDDGDAGLTVTIEDGNGNDLASASASAEGPITLEGGSVPDSGSDTSFGWTGTWKNGTNNTAYKLTKKTFIEVSSGASGSSGCATSAFPIVDRGNTSFTTAEAGTEIQYEANASSGELTLNPSDESGFTVTSLDSDPVTFVDCEVQENQAPVIDSISTPNSPTIDTELFLSAAASDADGDDLSYSWSITEAPTGNGASLTGAASASFIPTAEGDYNISLTVTDGNGGSASRTVTLSVTAGDNTENQAPTIGSTSAPDSVSIGSQVSLSASASDPDDDDLSYSWSLTPPTDSEASLTGSGSSDVTFTPDLVGDYRITLEVADPKGGTDSSTLTVTATSSDDGDGSGTVVITFGE
jgi:hypothetical protein